MVKRTGPRMPREPAIAFRQMGSIRVGYASFSNSGVVVGNPDRIWEAFAHPEIAAMYAEHQVRVVPSPGFELAVGNSWAEHHGEECGFDVVLWTITRYEPRSVIEFRGRQTGVLQRVRLAMEPSETGHRLTEEISFSPAIAGQAGPSVIAWLLLATGLLARLGNDQGQTFELLRKHKAGSPKSRSRTG